ncbi:MAG TPA: hypothetical protein VHZ24_02690 [Pirellulales bacterium]|nr:hypothetical protein [Pirellulales bacterium]
MGSANQAAREGAAAAGRVYEQGRQKAEEVRHDVQGRVQDAAQAFQDKASEAAGQARDAAHKAREYVHDQAEHLRDAASDYLQEGRSRAMEFGETVEDQIRQQPLRAVLIAAAVGLVVGMFWTRRR